MPGLNAPLPLLLQVPELVTPLTVPDKATELLLEHTGAGEVILTMASCCMAIFTVSLTAGQGPLLTDVSVKLTEPFVISVGVNE